MYQCSDATRIMGQDAMAELNGLPVIRLIVDKKFLHFRQQTRAGSPGEHCIN